MDRREEVRRLLRLTPQQVQQRAGDRLVVCPDVDSLHRRMAQDIAGRIQANNARRSPTRLILPVGPTGQYPILAELINSRHIDLSGCWFFFMDEYCDDQGMALSKEHPLSFKGQAERLFFSRLDSGSALRQEQVIFPDEANITKIGTIIEKAGGIDECYGGIGIHGHVAFNEPEAGVKNTGPRRVRVNDFTLTINAIRSAVGGNLACYPREAFTLGMRDILSAGAIRLYCRNGCEFDWANTVLRLALFGAPGDDYTVTHIRGSNYTIVTDRETLASPRYLI